MVIYIYIVGLATGNPIFFLMYMATSGSCSWERTWELIASASMLTVNGYVCAYYTRIRVRLLHMDTCALTFFF